MVLKRMRKTVERGTGSELERKWKCTRKEQERQWKAPGKV